MYAWVAFFLLCVLASDVHAGTVCRIISTGQVAETFSITQPDGTCVKDLTSSGISAGDIAQDTVSEEGRIALLKTWDANPSNPEMVRRKSAELAHQSKEKDIQTKLGLSPADFQELREALK